MCVLAYHDLGLHGPPPYLQHWEVVHPDVLKCCHTSLQYQKLSFHGVSFVHVRASPADALQCDKSCALQDRLSKVLLLKDL